MRARLPLLQLALNGIAFKGQPLLVQASMAEKNRLAQASKNVAAAASLMGGTAPSEPTKLVVSELHASLGQSDVAEVFAGLRTQQSGFLRPQRQGQ